MPKRSLVGVALCLSLAACEFTRITAIRDPAAPLRPYQRVLVVAPFSEVDLRSQAESAFADKLQANDVAAIRSIQVLLPTRTYSGEEVEKVILDIKADSVLLITSADVSSVPFYLPSYSTTTGHVGAYGSFSATTTEYGGHSVPLPTLRCELKLVDLSSGRMVWVASSESEGGVLDDFGTLIRAIAGKAMRQLEKDGFIAAPPR